MAVEPEFVGAGRHKLVEELLEAFDGVIEAGTPRLVCLEAPSGWGKSRLIQELYRRLAADRQDQPGYWPASILQTLSDSEPSPRHEHAGMDVAARRKRIHPEVFDPAEGSVPTWLWWGISAANRPNGLAIQSLREDLDQLEVHRDALERRWRQQASLRQRARRAASGDGARGLTQTVAGEGVAAGVGMLAGPAAPAVPFVMWASQQAWAKLKATRERDPESAIDARSADREGLSVKLARELGEFAAVGIPTVIAVEDVHDADAALIDLLVTVLTERRGPVLIITTSWSATLDETHRQAHRLLADVPGPSRHRLTAATHTATSTLAALSDDDRIALALSLLPETTTAAQARLIATRFTNPLALELACALPLLRDLIDDDELDAGALEQVPDDIYDLYRLMWLALPEPIRERLMAAVLATPRSLGGLFADRTWDAELAAATAEMPPWLNEAAGHRHAHLEERADAYGWIRHIDEWLRACHDPDQHAIAARSGEQRLTPKRRRRFYQQLAEHVDLDPAQPEPRRYARARLLVAIASEGFVAWEGQPTVAAELLIEESARADDADSLNTVISLTAVIPEELGDSLSRRAHRATALATLGRLDQAIDQASRLLADQLRILGPDDPGTLATRNNLAFWHGEAGRIDDAVDQFTSLLDDLLSTLGLEDRRSLGARNNLAYWLGLSGHVDDAIDQSSRLLADQLRILGPDDPATLTSRNNLAFWHGKTGRIDDAIDEFTSLLDDRIRVLGLGHADTLATRKNLANQLGASGRTDDAITQLRELLDDQRRILGSDHPDTLSTRNSLGVWLADCGRIDDAIGEFTSLLHDHMRLLGSEHRETLSTRQNLAHLLGESGRANDAITHLRELLDDQRRILDPDHPDTLTTRHNLAGWLGQAGRVDDAISHLRELLDDQRRILGPDHPDTLNTRQNLAHLLGASGRTDDAITQLHELLDDQRRILDPDHPDTLGTRKMLANWLGNAGRIDDAITRLRELRDDQRRILDRDHIDTLATRCDLALWLVVSGQHVEGADQCQRLLSDCLRLLGTNHPLTVATDGLLHLAREKQVRVPPSHP